MSPSTLRGARIVLAFVVLAAILACSSLRDSDPAHISVRVTPARADAMVFMDGEQVGAAPLTIERVEPGAHRIEVRAEGYELYSIEVAAREGNTTQLQVALTAEQ